MADVRQDNGLFVRGDKSSNVAGSLTFFGLRAVDPLLQYAILAKGYGTGVITALGGTVLEQGPTTQTGISVIDSLGLSPYRLAIVAIATGAWAKQCYWKAFIGESNIPPRASVVISFFSLVPATLASLLYLNRATSAAAVVGEGPDSPGWPGSRLVIGGTLVAVGLLTEFVSELQRKAFKDKPENKGKAYTGGLFSLARHINYTGFVMWRVGWGFATSGWIFGAFSFAFYAPIFVRESVPEIQRYCEQRYGSQWEEYCKRTPYKLIPYVY